MNILGNQPQQLPPQLQQQQPRPLPDQQQLSLPPPGQPLLKPQGTPNQLRILHSKQLNLIIKNLCLKINNNYNTQNYNIVPQDNYKVCLKMFITARVYKNIDG
jgi:hypothetical protein